MRSYLKMIPCGAVLALTVAGASAQTTTAPATSQPPKAIGVSPQTAVEAEQKAIPRSDTGTVVRTAPSAADQTRSAVENTTSGRSASGTLDTTRSTAETTTTTTTTETSRSAGASRDSSVQTAMRRPRADRN